MELIGKNVLDAWKKALKYIFDNGADFEDQDSRLCREILNLTVVVSNPEDDYDKPIDIMSQFDWVYPSKEELSSIIMNKEESAAFEFTYGSRIYNFRGKNQISDFIIPLLKKDPSSRRAIITLYDPAKDSNVISKNIPSLMFIHFKIIEKRLDLTCYIRSNDFFIGWPGNIYQLFALHKFVSEQLSLELGSLTTISSSAHIFHEHFDVIQRILVK